MLITKEFTFSAAHALPHYHGTCERMHGHNYRLQVTVSGQPSSNGLVLDFLILKQIVQKQVLDKVDHHNLNEHFENPTCELMAQWIWQQLHDFTTLLREEAEDPNLSAEIKALLKEGGEMKKEVSFGVRLYEVRLFETDTSWVTIRDNIAFPDQDLIFSM